MDRESGRRIVVAGGGSWGTALGHMLAARGHRVTLLVRSAAVATHVSARHENPSYLRGMPLHPTLDATTDMTALRTADIIVLSVPCQHLRGWLAAALPHVRPGTVVVNTAKGLEEETLARCSELVGAIWPETRYAMLSGPSFAAEVVAGKATAVVLACMDEALGAELRAVFSSPSFRCYSSTDVIGVELGGALKNVMAIAAGVCDGLGMGANTRAALMTRGIAELSRLGAACGARPLTFMGLSGVGDLMLTCTGDLSRNRQVGVRLGRGESLPDIVASLGMVAEGVRTAAAAWKLSRRLDVEAPIIEAMHDVLHGRRTVRRALEDLMGRELKEE
ncbi:MAG: NAD(P)-dependent glycerol-3-phosphate dehydrogenase [Desulfovibrionaceae bacterium]|nr:NAD(P)-dependent glycerol-3-phosphate dehydrogenase [Desulfovibrionaceae bacterium]